MAQPRWTCSCVPCPLRSLSDQLGVPLAPTSRTDSAMLKPGAGELSVKGRVARGLGFAGDTVRLPSQSAAPRKVETNTPLHSHPTLFTKTRGRRGGVHGPQRVNPASERRERRPPGHSQRLQAARGPAQSETQDSSLSGWEEGLSSFGQRSVGEARDAYSRLLTGKAGEKEGTPRRRGARRDSQITEKGPAMPAALCLDFCRRAQEAPGHVYHAERPDTCVTAHCCIPRAWHL